MPLGPYNRIKNPKPSSHFDCFSSRFVAAKTNEIIDPRCHLQPSSVCMSI